MANRKILSQIDSGSEKFSTRVETPSSSVFDSPLDLLLGARGDIDPGPKSHRQLHGRRGDATPDPDDEDRLPSAQPCLLEFPNSRHAGQSKAAGLLPRQDLGFTDGVDRGHDDLLGEGPRMVLSQNAEVVAVDDVVVALRLRSPPFVASASAVSWASRTRVLSPTALTAAMSLSSSCFALSSSLASMTFVTCSMMSENRPSRNALFSPLIMSWRFLSRSRS